MKHWPFYLLLVVAIGLLAVLFAGMVRSHLRTRGEESGVPEEPVPDVARDEARAALDAVLVDRELAKRRLRTIVRNEPDLRNMATKLDSLFVNGADR